MKDVKSILPLILVLACAVFLRFFHLTDLPFTTDEFSIIFRLNYPNLHELIQHGVKELDNHPAGYQLFYYGYTKLFGINEVSFKLPNLVLGVLSVYLIYNLGKNWFNSTAGLFAASMMVFMQYAVVQSQTARMYGFGIAFILLAVLFWDKFLKAKTVNYYYLAAFIVFASISCIIHYFSLLFILILGLSGLFLTGKTNRWHYVLSGLIIVLLFLPSLNIFLFQLKKGGIQAWLGEFHWSFFTEYFSYLFHFSWILVVTIAIIFALGFKLKLSMPQRKYRILTLLWFLLPIAIGTLYSIFFNNVMHFKALYFSFPFFLLMLASFIRESKPRFELIMVIVLVTVGSWSLITERMHYKLFCNDSTVFIYKNAVNWTQNIPADSIGIYKCTYINGDKYYSAENIQLNPDVVYIDSVSVKEFHHLIKNSNKPYLYIGATANVSRYIAIALRYYPQIVKKEYTIAAEAYLLKRDKDTLNESGKSAQAMGISSNEFFGSLNFSFDTLVCSNKDILDISIDGVELDTVGGAKLVCCITDGEKNVSWQVAEFDDFMAYNQPGTVIFPVSLLGIKLNKNLKAKVYVWNRNQAKYEFGKISVRLRSGNPFIYASDQKIDKPLSQFYNYKFD